MEVFGVDVSLVGALSIVVIGIVQWLKGDGYANIPNWAIRLASLIVSAAVVYLFMLGQVIDWVVYIKYSFTVWLASNGIWHTADQVGRSINKQ